LIIDSVGDRNRVPSASAGVSRARKFLEEGLTVLGNDCGWVNRTWYLVGTVWGFGHVMPHQVSLHSSMRMRRERASPRLIKSMGGGVPVTTRSKGVQMNVPPHSPPFTSSGPFRKVTNNLGYVMLHEHRDRSQKSPTQTIGRRSPYEKNRKTYGIHVGSL
jgi:hypothetical protein